MLFLFIVNVCLFIQLCSSQLRVGFSFPKRAGLLRFHLAQQQFLSVSGQSQGFAARPGHDRLAREKHSVFPADAVAHRCKDAVLKSLDLDLPLEQRRRLVGGIGRGDQDQIRAAQSFGPDALRVVAVKADCGKKKKEFNATVDYMIGKLRMDGAKLEVALKE